MSVEKYNPDIIYIDVEVNKKAYTNFSNSIKNDEEYLEWWDNTYDKYISLEPELEKISLNIVDDSKSADFNEFELVEDSIIFSLKMGFYKDPQQVIDILKKYETEDYEVYKKNFPNIFEDLKKQGYKI